MAVDQLHLAGHLTGCLAAGELADKLFGYPSS